MTDLGTAFLSSLALATGLSVLWVLACRNSDVRRRTCERDGMGGLVAWLAILSGVFLAGRMSDFSALFGVVCTSSVLLYLGFSAERLSLAAGRLLRWCAGIAAAVGLAWAGIRVDGSLLPSMLGISPATIALVASAVWMAVVTLLVLQANRGEGLVSGVGALSGLTLYLVSLLAGDRSASAASGRLLCLVLVGALGPCTLAGLACPALRFGGGASLAVGSMLAAATVLGALKTASIYVVIIPLLALGAPLLGTAMAWARSCRAGARGMAPIRNWPSFLEVLVTRGLSQRKAVVFLLCWHAYLCLVALTVGLLMGTGPWLKALLVATLPLGGLVLFYVSFQVAVGGKRPLPALEAGLRDQVQLLDVAVDRLSMDQAIGRIASFIEEGGHHHVITIDAGGILRAREDEEFRRIVRAADLVTPDGAGVVLAARLKDKPFHHRVAGCDLMGRLCEEASRAGWSVFLLGAAPGVAEEASEVLRSRFIGLKVAGAMHGYFTPEDEESVVQGIAQARPDIVFVALGLPAQEKFIARHAARLAASVCMGVGGSFDVYAGRVRRAPLWAQRLWLEFLWRSLTNPRRSRRLFSVMRFFVALALDTVRRPSAGS